MSGKVTPVDEEKAATTPEKTIQSPSESILSRNVSPNDEDRAGTKGMPEKTIQCPIE